MGFYNYFVKGLFSLSASIDRFASIVYEEPVNSLNAQPHLTRIFLPLTGEIG
jgi:hypothetical protein